ncbi:DUF4882 family protein [Acinetobacter sp. ULE_I010]|uniref:DUF4882 family protein n=1 Tax=Acinetobacter sp. ULE_I010 TaxID=3373065 RepID=UPI003AF9EDBE
MKKILLAIVMGTGTISSWAACTYNFDKITGTSDNVYPVVNLVEQKISGNIDAYKPLAEVTKSATSNTLFNYLTTHSIGDSNYRVLDKAIANSTGKIAFEANFDVSNINLNMGSGEESFEYGLQMLGSSAIKNELIFNISFAAANNFSTYDNGYYIILNGYSLKKGTNNELVPKDLLRDLRKINIPTNGQIKVGVYIDQSSKQVGYIINGVNYGLTSVVVENSLQNIGFIGNINPTQFQNSVFTNKNVSVQLLTDYSKMTQVYPTGTKDICGNTI